MAICQSPRQYASPISRYEIPSGFIVKRVAQAWTAPSAMARSQKKIRTRRGLRRCGSSSRDASLTDVSGDDRDRCNEPSSRSQNGGEVSEENLWMIYMLNGFK